MAWTDPKTWTSEPLTSSDLNTQLRDNMEALKLPPTAHYDPQETADYTTTSTAFVDVDSTNLSLTITLGDVDDSDVMIGFHATVNSNTDSRVYFDIDVDGTRLGNPDGIIFVQRNDTADAFDHMVSFVRLVTGLSAGSHTFTLQWKVSSGSATLHAGAGTANRDVIPQFWVREVS